MSSSRHRFARINMCLKTPTCESSCPLVICKCKLISAPILNEVRSCRWSHDGQLIPSLHFGCLFGSCTNKIMSHPNFSSHQNSSINGFSFFSFSAPSINLFLRKLEWSRYHIKWSKYHFKGVFLEWILVSYNVVWFKYNCRCVVLYWDVIVDSFKKSA